MTLWMKVTEDEYELPVLICESVNELAELVGCTPNNIYSCISKSKTQGHNTYYKKVVIEDEL